MRKFKQLSQVSRSKILSLSAVLLFLLALICCKLFCNLNFDLSKNKQNSLNSATFELFSEIQQPVKIVLYVSLSAASNSPKLEKFVFKTLDFLQKYAKASQNKINIQILDTQKFSQFENQAMDFGFIGLNTDRIFEKIYLAWQIKFDENSQNLQKANGAYTENLQNLQKVNDAYTENLQNSQKVKGAYVLRDLLISGDANLEYQLAEDILQLLKKQKQTQKPKLGIISGIDFLPSFNFQTGKKTAPNPAYFALSKKYELVDLSIDAQAPFDFLLAISPNFLPSQDFAIVENSLELGVPTILILDKQNAQRLNFVDQNQTANNQNIADFLHKFGLVWNFANSVQDDSASNLVISNYGDLSLNSDLVQLHKNNFVEHSTLKNLNSILVATSTSFDFLQNSHTKNYEFLPLIEFSKNAKFVNLDEAFLDETSKQTQTPKYFAGILQTNNTNIDELDLKPETRMALIGDSDFLNSNLWLKNSQNSSLSANGFLYANLWQDNLFFLENLLDFFSEDKILLALRKQQQAPLPFAKLEKIRSQAKQKYANILKRYENQINKIDAELIKLNISLNELTEKTDLLADEKLFASSQIAEQKAQLLETRQEVSKNLLQTTALMQEQENKLKFWIEFFMVYFAPLLISGAYVLVWIIRRLNRKRHLFPDQRSGSSRHL